MSPSTRLDGQPLAVGHEAILGELGRRVVQHGDGRAGRSENRSLLTTPGSQTKHVEAGQGGKPLAGHRLRRREEDLPLPAARGGDDLGANGDGPAVALGDGAVPGTAVVEADVHGVSSALDEAGW